jgi:glutamate/tyrosine decarboxylase-like PLP-dependent enzyme
MAKDTHPAGYQPEIVLPSTAHPAFLKACHYLNVLPRIVPVREDKRADPVKTMDAINEQTVMLVVSAPCFPFGVIDPVEEFSRIARQRNILLHVDACMGGFMLPFMNEAGYPVPPFDFSLPGVTSISLDPHKYGYSMKGVSVILYRHPEMRKKQFFVCTDWPGGIFASTALLGTRSGGPLASAWAMIKLMGKEGYIQMVRDVMEAVNTLKPAVQALPGLRIISNPDMSILAITSDEFDILYIADLLEEKGWHLDRQQLPDSLHFTVSAGNIRVIDDFIVDLREVMQHTRKLRMENRLKKIILRGAQRISNAIPGTTIGRMASLFALKQNKTKKKHSSGQAAFYGLTGSLPDREKVSDAVLELLDGMYR